MCGLLAGLGRKNGWTFAEHAGAVSPDGMQRMLRTADWGVDGVRDDVRDYVLDALGSSSSLISPVNQTVSLFLEVSVADRIRYSGSRQQKGP